MALFDLHTPESAPDGGDDAIRAAEEAFGFAPNLIRVLAESPQAAEAYLKLGELFGSTTLSAVEQQVVILAISFENGCHYCMAVHSAVAKQAGASDGVIEALRAGETLPDDRLQALARFTRTLVRERGWVDDAEIRAFLDAGFEKRNVLDVILGVAQKTLSNYANHLAETPLDEPFRDFAWERPERAGAAAD